MKILKEGAFKEREYKETCRYCGCVFLFNKDEVDVKERSRGSNLRYVRCPYCDHILYVGTIMDEEDKKYDEGAYALTHG